MITRSILTVLMIALLLSLPLGFYVLETITNGEIASVLDLLKMSLLVLALFPVYTWGLPFLAAVIVGVLFSNENNVSRF